MLLWTILTYLTFFKVYLTLSSWFNCVALLLGLQIMGGKFKLQYLFSSGASKTKQWSYRGDRQTVMSMTWLWRAVSRGALQTQLISVCRLTTVLHTQVSAATHTHTQRWSLLQSVHQPFSLLLLSVCVTCGVWWHISVLRAHTHHYTFSVRTAADIQDVI